MKTVRSNWSDAILVCAKCSKKLDGGFGPKGKAPLGKALRKHLHVKKGRKAAAGIVEVKCLGICPRGAVTVVNGARSREWLLVPEGADLDVVVANLGLSAPVNSDEVAGSFL
ncbi:(2Fe-2S) ferredoxin domain-containing protein [Sphingomonas sp. S2-65]|uniref:(2Fe-2S) ferredoxin domain-containing protein n=1 Tax=Sphingomonas sp. S2-65 TaxID=2903960 RepID=UPI001F2064A7|nr:(2Fe-2S) ferredoxin domain-containing protein [Sphingomonas sp. S2-65]UYY58734.1 (2Fe-2S) ferredoxin domain-containing protein [Sphingomonas sp. S2-65]